MPYAKMRKSKRREIWLGQLNSAYNGGPGALGRYRGVRQSPTWKKVDEAFWEKFQVVSAGNEMAVKTCYEK